MSLPSIPNITPSISLKRCETVDLLLSSIALEEIGLSHILNAEAEKLQRFLEMRDTCFSDYLQMNKSINNTLKTVVKSQLLLQLKLEETVSIDDSEEENCDEPECPCGNGCGKERNDCCVHKGCCCHEYEHCGHCCCYGESYCTCKGGPNRCKARHHHPSRECGCSQENHHRCCSHKEERKPCQKHYAEKYQTNSVNYKYRCPACGARFAENRCECEECKANVGVCEHCCQELEAIGCECECHHMNEGKRVNRCVQCGCVIQENDSHR